MVHVNQSQENQAFARRQPLSRKIRLSSNALIVVLIILICTVGLLYLIEFNKISTMGILIDDGKNLRDKLIIENEVWNMRIANLKSLDVIQTQETVRSMVNIDNVEYMDKK